MPTLADFERIVDRLEWSWDHLQRYKLALVDSGVNYHWIPKPLVETSSGRYVDFVVDNATQPPEHVKFVIGDCIHSLRASLDNLIYAICPTDRSEFLICKTKKQWRNNVSKVEQLEDAARDELLLLQPFNVTGISPESNPLWILDRLWNDDKHRAPRLMFGITDQAQIDSGSTEISAIFSNGPLVVGEVIARVWILSDPVPELIPSFAFDIAFDPWGPANGVPVYDFLVGLHHIVGDVVHIFQRFFVE